MKKLRYLLEFVLLFSGCALIRTSPRFALKLYSGIVAGGLWLWGTARKVACANLEVAFPDRPRAWVRKTALQCFYNVVLNMFEFLWMAGRPDRIEHCTLAPFQAFKTLLHIRQSGKRIIFVNPHLGSWEVSGLMAPHYGGMKLVAIAKPVKNPYINRALNNATREREQGLRIIYSKGAMRECIKALKRGCEIGTLIDQNTRVRYGGTFVEFFGLQVASSTAPAVLAEYCRKNNMSAEIVYATCLRRRDGRVQILLERLSKPFEEYASPEEVLQELMRISEKYIRLAPSQYLWFYKRFQNIPMGASEELKSRYPFYATMTTESFYSQVARKKAKEKARAEAEMLARKKSRGSSH